MSKNEKKKRREVAKEQKRKRSEEAAEQKQPHESKSQNANGWTIAGAAGSIGRFLLDLLDKIKESLS